VSEWIYVFVFWSYRLRVCDFGSRAYNTGFKYEARVYTGLGFAIVNSLEFEEYTHFRT
jgi:hypothetical protein